MFNRKEKQKVEENISTALTTMKHLIHDPNN